MKKSFALSLTSAIALAVSQTKLDGSLYEIDPDFSTKFIGKISWQSTFDQWVLNQIPLLVNPNEHVCGYTWNSGQVTSSVNAGQNSTRDGLHVSHNCSAELVQQIHFEYTMQDPGDVSLIYDKNQNF